MSEQEKRHYAEVPTDASYEELKEIGRELYDRLHADKAEADQRREDDDG